MTEAEQQELADELAERIRSLFKRNSIESCITGPLSDGKRYIVLPMEDYEAHLRNREKRGRDAALRTQPHADSVEQVERVVRAMAEALREYCTDADGRCYATIDSRICPQEGMWGAEVDGEIDLIPLAKAAIQSLQPDIQSLLAAERERCAKIADDFERQENGAAWDKRQAGRDDNFNCARASAAAHIAQAIRSLGEVGG